MKNINGWIVFFCRLILCVLLLSFVVGPFLIPSEFGMLGKAAVSIMEVPSLAVDYVRYINAAEICAEGSELHEGVTEACDYRDAYLAK